MPHLGYQAVTATRINLRTGPRPAIVYFNPFRPSVSHSPDTLKDRGLRHPCGEKYRDDTVWEEYESTYLPSPPILPPYVSYHAYPLFFVIGRYRMRYSNLPGLPFGAITSGRRMGSP